MGMAKNRMHYDLRYSIRLRFAGTVQYGIAEGVPSADSGSQQVQRECEKS